jgi:hypothetical protein
VILIFKLNGKNMEFLKKIFCGMRRTWVAARHPKKRFLLEHRFAWKVQTGDASPAAG